MLSDWTAGLCGTIERNRRRRTNTHTLVHNRRSKVVCLWQSWVFVGIVVFRRRSLIAE